MVLYMIERESSKQTCLIGGERDVALGQQAVHLLDLAGVVVAHAHRPHLQASIFQMISNDFICRPTALPALAVALALQTASVTDVPRSTLGAARLPPRCTRTATAPSASTIRS